MPLRGQPPCDCGAGNFCLAPHRRPHRRPLDDGGQFCQAVGDVSRLITKPLARDQQITFRSEPRSLLLFQSGSHLGGKMRRIPHGKSYHGLAARAIDVLASRPGTAGKLPGERVGWNHDRAAGETKGSGACHAITVCRGDTPRQRQHAGISGRRRPGKTVIWTVRAQPPHTSPLSAAGSGKEIAGCGRLDGGCRGTSRSRSHACFTLLPVS